MKDYKGVTEPKLSVCEQAAFACAFLGLMASKMINLLAICNDDLRESISDKNIILLATAVCGYLILWALISQSYELLKAKPENKERIMGEFKATLFVLPLMGFFIAVVPWLFFMNDGHKMIATVGTALTESVLLFSALITGGMNVGQEMKKHMFKPNSI